jgi:mannose-6-phosphate isomerase-like protein (cupin superfamily)
MNEASGQRVFSASEGKTYNLDRLTLVFKNALDSEASGYSVCVGTSEPGWSGTRLHRHGFEEWHVQIEGASEWQLGRDRFVLNHGDMVFVPRGVPHGFTAVGTGQGSQLLISSPPGLFEGFIADVISLERGTAPPDARTFQDVCDRYGIEFLDPAGERD